MAFQLYSLAGLDVAVDKAYQLLADILISAVRGFLQFHEQWRSAARGRCMELLIQTRSNTLMRSS
jgi:hypothetical protein